MTSNKEVLVHFGNSNKRRLIPNSYSTKIIGIGGYGENFGDGYHHPRVTRFLPKYLQQTKVKSCITCLQDNEVLKRSFTEKKKKITCTLLKMFDLVQKYSRTLTFIPCK